MNIWYLLCFGIMTYVDLCSYYAYAGDYAYDHVIVTYDHHLRFMLANPCVMLLWCHAN